MKKIKVMNVIYRMGAGGAQQVVLNYLNDLKDDKDIEIVLYVYKGKTNSKYERIIDENKLNVKYLDVKHKKGFLLAKIYNYIINKKIWCQVFEKEKPDIVHIHISGFIPYILPAIRKKHIKVVFNTLHSNPLRQKGRTLYLIKKAFKKEKFIPICLTNEQAKLAKQHYEIDNYEIVKNGIDFEYIEKNKMSKNEARKLYNIPSSSFVVLGVGRLNAIKRYDLLIHSFKILLEKCQNSILIFAGDGPEKEKLIKLTEQLQIKDNVMFLGNQDNVIPLYCASDVFALTSKSEALPLVLLEAQICGTRSVISNGVPTEAICTNIVEKMRKDASAEEWCDSLLNKKFKGIPYCNIKDFELHRTTNNMKEIYIKYYQKSKKRVKENEK